MRKVLGGDPKVVIIGSSETGSDGELNYRGSFYSFCLNSMYLLRRSPKRVLAQLKGPPAVAVSDSIKVKHHDLIITLVISSYSVLRNSITCTLSLLGYNRNTGETYEVPDIDGVNIQLKVQSGQFSLTSNQTRTVELSGEDLFIFLDRIGESWSDWGVSWEIASNYIVRKKIRYTVVKDHLFKKRNLKGLVAEVVITKRQLKDKEGNLHLLCKFDEDVQGSSLDGKSAIGNYLFMPAHVMQESE